MKENEGNNCSWAWLCGKQGSAVGTWGPGSGSSVNSRSAEVYTLLIFPRVGINE